MRALARRRIVPSRPKGNRDLRGAGLWSMLAAAGVLAPRSAAVVSVGLAIMTHTTSAQAQVKTWNATTGNWVVGANWSPTGAPAAANDVVVNNGGTAQITSSVTASRLVLGQNAGTSGTVTIGTGGSLTTVSGGSGDDIGFRGSGTLRLTGGGLYNFGSHIFVLGLNAGSSGTVTIDGPGSRLFGTGDAFIATLGTSSMTLTNGGAFAAANLRISDNTNAQTGTLNVFSASQVTLTGSLTAGANSGTRGIVNVDGTGSLITSNGAIIGSTGTGILTLTNGGTFNAGSTMTLGRGYSGTLNIGVGGAPGFVVGNVAGGVGAATVNFNHNDPAYVFSSLISGGTLAVNQIGTGTTILTGANTYAGGTTISTGTLQLGNGGTTGSIVGNVTDNGRLVFDRSDVVTFSGLISGSGAVSQIGTGMTVLTANNTYTGATTISAGTLQLGNGGVTGSVVGDIIDNSVLVFDRSNVMILPGVISGTGTVTQAGTGTTALTGNSTYTGGTTISAGTLQLGNGGTTGSIVGNVTDNGVLAFNRSNTLDFGGVISGSGAVSQIGTGTTVLGGANTYSGPTTVAAGTLRAGAKGAFSPNSVHTVEAVGTLDLAGFDQTIPGLFNFGKVITGGAPDAGAAATLTVAGNYTAHSILQLTTVLAGDGSPSDLLVIDGGTATGNTSIVVNNAGGPGAVTTGDGILVVNTTNGGTTSPGAFVAGAPVVAGPYEYTLERGSIVGGNAQAWFLRSALDCALVPSLPECVGPKPPEPPPVPPTPHYRPQVSLYTAIPPMAAIYGRQLIGTLHERVGEEEQLKGRVDLREKPNFNGAWGRVIGQWGHADGDALGIYRGGPEYDYGFGALQLGTDVYGKEYDNGARDHAGLYAAFGHGDVDVTHNLLERSFDAGSDDFNAFTVGGYWTRFWENNAYLDGVVQGTWYDVTSKSQRNTLLGFPDQQVNGFGFAASLEGGYPFYFGDGWQIEPQAQMIYQAISFDTFNDGAADVRFEDTNSLPSRIGARLARNWTVEEASGDKPVRLATVWGRVNLWHNFLDADVTTSFSSANGFIPFTANLEDTWIEADLGGTLELTPAASLYGNVDFSTSFDGDAYSIGGKLGLRMNW